MKKSDEKDTKLSDEEVKALANYFDVLIQMDLEQKRKTKLEEEKKSETSEAD